MNRAVMIEADKARNLRFGTNALCQMEEMTGKSVNQLNESAGMKELRIMMYCGLRWEDKELTIEKTGEIMDEIMSKHGIDYLSEKIGKAMELAIPNGKK